MSLDREIEDLLAVDPSPDFVARVRRRVAEAPVPGRSWFSWMLVPVAVGVAAIAFTVIVWPVDSTPSSTEATVSQPGSVETTVDLPARAPQIETVSRPTRRAAIVAQPDREPEVLISPDEARALELLLARLREGRLPDMTESLATVDTTGPAWIAIAPVEIDPIPQGEGE